MERTQQIDSLFENLPQFYKQIEGYLLQVVRSRDVASDLTQDTFLKMLERLDQYDPQKGSIYTWVNGIARNIAYDHLRRYRTRANSWPRLRAETQRNPTPEEIVRSEELLDFADENLTPRQKQVAKLRGEGYSHKEIEEILGITESASKLRIHNAKKKMRLYC